MNDGGRDREFIELYSLETGMFLRTASFGTIDGNTNRSRKLTAIIDPITLCVINNDVDITSTAPYVDDTPYIPT